MATFIRPEIRSTVEEILAGTRTSCRFPENAEHGRPQEGDKILFYSATTVPNIPEAVEPCPDVNPLAVTVCVSKVEDVDYTALGLKYSYRVSWDGCRDVFSEG